MDSNNSPIERRLAGHAVRTDSFLPRTQLSPSSECCTPLSAIKHASRWKRTNVGALLVSLRQADMAPSGPTASRNEKTRATSTVNKPVREEG